jgi:hypothetical protein
MWTSLSTLWFSRINGDSGNGGGNLKCLGSDDSIGLIVQCGHWPKATLLNSVAI